MRIARWALVWLVIAVALASAGPREQAAQEIQKLDQQLTQYQIKQAYLPAIKLERRLLELEIVRSGPDSREADDRRRRLASSLEMSGDYDEARKLYADLVARAERLHGAESKEALEARELAIGPDQRQFRFQELDAGMQRVLALSKKIDGEHSANYARQLEFYAWAQNGRNDYSGATRTYEAALQIVESLPDNQNLLQQSLTVLASFYWGANDKPKAIATYDRAIKLAEKSPDATVMSVGMTIWGVAAMYHWGGRDDLAKPLMAKVIASFDQEAARLEKTKPDDFQIVQMLSQAGYMAQQSGDLAGAEQRMRRAITLDEKARKAPSGYSFMLAGVLRQQGKPKEALALFEKLRAQYGTTPTMAHMYDSTIADVLRELGDYKRAEKLMIDYLPSIAKTFGRSHPTYAANELMLAYIYMSAGDFTNAERTLGDCLDIYEKELQTTLQLGTEADHASYFSRNAYHLDVAVNFNYSLAPKNAGAARLALTTLLRRKGRALDASAAVMATIRSKLSPADKQLLDNLASARQKLAKLTVAGPAAAGDGEYAKEIAALEDQVQKLEIEVGKASAAYRAVSAQIQLPAIQKLVPKTAKLVEIVNFQPGEIKKYYQYAYGVPKPPRRYAAYVLGATGDPVFVDLAPAPDIDAAVEKFRKAVSDPNNTKVPELGRALYDLTIAKIQPALGGSTELIVAPDGALSVVPFSALVDTKGKFLVEKYTFTYLTSGRDLLRLQVQSKAQGGGVIFADPAFDATPKTAPAKSRGRRSSDLASLSWPALPGTGQEGAAVAKTMKTLKLITGAAATETAVKAVHGPRILHLATHGFFLPDEAPPPTGDGAPKLEAYENPLLRSGLALAGANKLASGDDDGILTALEASGLDLEGTQLVVLSACETGVGKVSNGEGVYGLRRSLIVAGAQSLVMSLWQVDDEATRDLMVGYYQKLAQGHARSTALREVQLELAATAKYKHPYYWASFLPAGDNSPLRD